MVDPAPEWAEVAKQQVGRREECEAEFARRWLEALRAAPGDGKELFDLETFRDLLPHYDEHFEEHGYVAYIGDPPPRPRVPRTWLQEVRVWERQYYQRPVMTMAALVEIECRWWEETRQLRERVKWTLGPKRRLPGGQRPPIREPEDQAEHERLVRLAEAVSGADVKERFEYNSLVVLLDDYRPNVEWIREQEIRWWMQQYYDHHPDTLTLAGFAAVVNREDLSPPTGE